MALTDPISEPQIAYIKGLLEKRDISSLPDAQREFLSPESEDELDANLRLMNKGQASACIKALLNCKFKPVEPEPVVETEVEQPEQTVIEIPLDDSEPDEVAPVQGLGTKAPDVPQGYFFIIDPTETDPDKVEKFFRVRHGRTGTKWEGYAFLDVQASDFFYPVRDPRRRSLIFAEIMKDPVAAMNEYGMRLGRCGVCNRTLTDRHSILRGIGPICAERLGPTDEQTEVLRKLGLI